MVFQIVLCRSKELMWYLSSDVTCEPSSLASRTAETMDIVRDILYTSQKDLFANHKLIQHAVISSQILVL